MAKLNYLHNIVLEILKENEAARGDDYLLIDLVFNKLGVNTKEMTFASVLKHHKTLCLPSFESVTRCRRKVQEQNPNLVNNDALQIREVEQGEYKQYAIDF